MQKQNKILHLLLALIFLFFSCSSYAFNNPVFEMPFQPSQTNINQQTPIIQDSLVNLQNNQLPVQSTPQIRFYVAPLDGLEAHIRSFEYSEKSAIGDFCRSIINRYYSPELGRFISAEPMLNYQDGANLYAMVNGNYLNLTDPLGLYSWGEFKDDIYHGVRGMYLMDKERRAAEWQKPILERVVESTPILGMAYGEANDTYNKYQGNRENGMGVVGSVLDAGVQKANEITGGQAILEAGFGIDRATGQELSTFDRSMKVLQGASQLFLTGVGALQAKEAMTGTKATGLETRGYKPSPGERSMTKSEYKKLYGESRKSYFSMVDPGPLPDKIAGTFAGGKYAIDYVQPGEFLWKGGDASNPGGSFFTFERPTSIAEVRIDTAVKSQWINPVTGVLEGVSPINSAISAKFPTGTKYYYGPTSYQNGIYMGGKTQIFVPDARKIGKFKVEGGLS